MLSRKPRRLAMVALAAGLAVAAGACGSSSKSATSTPSKPAAATDTVTAIPHLTGQGTTLTLNPTTAKALTSLKVSVAPLGTAVASDGGGAVTFPITSGYAEIHSNKSFKPGYILGSIQHFGSGLELKSGATAVQLTNFVVDPGNSMLYATVGAKPDVPLLFLNGANVAVSMQGSDVVLNGTVAQLTPTAASALDSAFHTSAITAGLPLGTVHLVAAGAANTYTDKTTDISRLSGDSTSVALDPSTAAALKSLGVSLGVSGTATFNASTSTVTFPITGGIAVIHSDHNYKPGYIAGVLIHQGSGITLSKGTKSVNLADFVVDPGNSTLTGAVGSQIGVPLLSLNGAPVTVSMVDGTVHLDGTIASLTATAAAALNQTFGTTAFKPGLELGTVHIIAAGS